MRLHLDHSRSSVITGFKMLAGVVGSGVIARLKLAGVTGLVTTSVGFLWLSWVLVASVASWITLGVSIDEDDIWEGIR